MRWLLRDVDAAREEGVHERGGLLAVHGEGDDAALFRRLTARGGEGNAWTGPSS